MFDAGAIEATLTVHLDQFNRDLDKAEERIRRIEAEKHIVKISAVFDTASMTRARKMFADLDMQISRDAAMRLKTSPQGSVLGSLNALFSPHPVAGSPTAQQSGQQGLLGKMFNTPGGGAGRPGPAAGPQQQPPGRTTGPAPGPGGVGPAMTVPGQQRDSKGRFTSGGGGGGSSNSLLFKLLSQMLGGDKRAQDVVSALTPNTKALTGFINKLGSAAGPGILGISAKRASQVGVGGSLLGALPALLGPLAALGVGGAGAGVLALGAKTLIGTKQDPGQLYNPAQKAGAALQGGLKTAAQPLVKPLEQAFSQIPSLIKSITPALTQLFAGASTLIQPFLQGITALAKDVLPGLGQAFRVVAPLMEPFLSSIGQLFKNLLPGLLSMLKAVQPILGVLEGVVGRVGTALGGLFSAIAPVMQPASVLLKAVLDLVLSLLPIIGQLAAIFASALAPAFQMFAGLLNQLVPVLIPIGKILAQLAGAVLVDLVGILQPLVQLIGALAPSFGILAKVLGDVFNALENTGIFQVLASALESVVGPLASFINMLVAQLAPFIPPLLQIFQSLVNAGINVFVTAILTLLPILTQLVQALLPPLLKIIVALTPTIAQLAQLMARGLGDAIVAIANVLAPLLVLIVKLIVGVVNWLNSTHLLLPVLGLLMLAIAPIPTAIGLIALAIGYLAEHWQRIWGDIKQWAKDAWDFIYNGFGKYLLPLLGPVGLIALGVIELLKHWKQVWGDIKQVGLDFYQWIWKDFGAKISNFITKTVPSWFDTAVGAIKTAWNKVEDVFKVPVNFLINTVYDGGIRRFWNDVMGAIGLGSLDLPLIKGLASGGKIHNGTGPRADDVLIRASRGETVVSAAHSAMLAPLFAAVGVPGYAGGGVVGDVGGVVAALLTGNTGALTNSLMDLVGVSKGTSGDLAQMVTGIPKKIIGDAVHWVSGSIGGIISALFGTKSAGSALAGIAGVVPGIANARLAQLMYPKWASGSDWAAWNYVAMRESGWSNTANNPSSGAYGIAQALPYTKMPKAAWPPSAGGSADPATQIMWMISYMLGRYGGPVGAAAHEQQFNWYGGGLDAVFSHPTVIGVGERGPEAVSVTPLASYGLRGKDRLDQLIAALGNDRPMIGTYQTAFYGTGDTAYAMRELARTLRVSRLQAVVGR
jgi:phage-related protein